MSFPLAAGSPNGKRIFADGFVPRGELIRYDGKTRDFKSFLGGISAGEVDFSRDGKWVDLCDVIPIEHSGAAVSMAAIACN